MKLIKYTPDAADKIRSMNRSLLMQYGSLTAKKIVGKITSAIRGLSENEHKGPSVEKMFGIESDYRYIFVAHNYVFYKVENTCIRIINVYNEKEDFMQLLFGIDTTPQETLDYWGEN